MRAIRTYAEGTKAATNDWDIRPSVAVKALSANISWTAEWIRMIELALGSAHQFVSNNIWCISKWQVLVEIQAYQCSDIISYLLKLAWQLVRCGSHWGGSPQNGLGDEQTCRTTLASAYVLRCLSAAWSQLQMKKRKSEWKWVLIGVSPLNTRDWV